MKPDRIEGFEHVKSYHTPPEYPGYDVKIPLQHGVSDPLNVFILYFMYKIIRHKFYDHIIVRIVDKYVFKNSIYYRLILIKTVHIMSLHISQH